jgi:hypothetical protein
VSPKWNLGEILSWTLIFKLGVRLVFPGGIPGAAAKIMFYFIITTIPPCKYFVFLIVYQI